MLSPRLIELPRFFGAVATAVLAQPGLHPAFRASFGLRRALCRSVSTGRIFAAAWQGLLKGLGLQQSLFGYGYLGLPVSSWGFTLGFRFSVVWSCCEGFAFSLYRFSRSVPLFGFTNSRLGFRIL